MENDSVRVSHAEAAEALDALSSDGQRLAQRAHTPWALLAALGAVAACWVGAAATTQPGANYEPSNWGWLGLVGVLVVAHLIRRETGIRFRSMGPRAGWALAGVAIGCLVLFSASLALTSLGLTWAVALTSLLAFAWTTWLASIAYNSAVEKIERG